MSHEPITDEPQEEQQIVPTHDEHEEDAAAGIPRGAFIFSLILIVGYAFYFFFTWVEIVLWRGGA